MGLLFSTGQINFTGDRALLLRAIDRVDGVLDNHGFHCTQYFPGRYDPKFFSRTKLSFVFHCSYTPCEGGYQITYRVLPGLSTLFLYLAALCLVIAGATNLVRNELAVAIGAWIAGAALFALPLGPRRTCVTRFQGFFCHGN